MAIQTEITVRVANSPGAAGRITSVLGAERINILAMSIEPGGHLRMVVDNPIHAVGVLREQHYPVDEREVLVAAIPNNPGTLTRTLKLLSDNGINIEYAYASGSDGSGTTAVVIGVEDAQRASYAAGI